MILRKINLHQILLRYGLRRQLQEGLLLLPKRMKASPLVVLLHGANRFGAWESLYRADRLTRHGLAVLLPSQIGFGGSRGERDFCGPRTIEGTAKLIEGVQRRFQNRFVSKTALWGISRGATIAAHLACEDIAIDAVVLQSGAYELQRDYQWPQKPEPIRARMREECGASPDALRVRSIFHRVTDIHCPTLLLHGQHDAIVEPSQAVRLNEALSQHGKESTLVLIPNAGHNLGQQGANAATTFILNALKSDRQCEAENHF